MEYLSSSKGKFAPDKVLPHALIAVPVLVIVIVRKDFVLLVAVISKVAKRAQMEYVKSTLNVKLHLLNKTECAPSVMELSLVEFVLLMRK